MYTDDLGVLMISANEDNTPEYSPSHTKTATCHVGLANKRGQAVVTPNFLKQNNLNR